jgi:hypothetical protein
LRNQGPSVPLSSTVNNESQKCRLCLEQAELCDSHIVPEFFFKRLYDDKHRFFGVSGNPGERIRVSQKGMRENLLCKKCEGQFSKYETYGSSVLYGEPFSVENLGAIISVGGIEYHRFKLFLLSLLWRLDATTLPFWQDIDIGSTHREKLRGMLVAEDPGEPWRYGCTVLRLLNDGRPFNGLVSSAARAKMKGYHLHGIAADGFVFSFCVSSHEPHFLNPGFLQKDGRLVVLTRELRDVPFLSQMANTVNAAMGDRALPV